MLSAITKDMIHDVFRYEEVNKTSTKCVYLDGKGKEKIEKGYLYNYNQKQKKWCRYPVSGELQETSFFSHLERAKICKKETRLPYYDETISDQFRLGTVNLPEEAK